MTSAIPGTCPPRRFVRRRTGAFSLIEVVLAAGILAVAVIPVVGLLAVGLTSSKDSTTGLAVSNIVRSLRADSQTNACSFFNDTRTSPQTHYFTEGGYPTAGDTNTNAFYKVDVSWNAPASSVTSSTSARVVLVNISYPYPANAQSSVTSFFVAQ
ncbi:MAG: Verru_Chthon cassette protein B [Rhodospirillales bacterium]|nr:Verru_Chthon cassette protein B [Acetobacter sp.]